MKKSIIKAVSILAVAAACFSFVACHDNIYNMIDEEVPLDRNGLKEIQKIVYLNGNLYAANGSIYRKTAQSSAASGSYNKQWSKINRPTISSDTEAPSVVWGLASDTSKLYAFVVSWKEDNSGGSTIKERAVYSSTDGTVWNRINFANAEPYWIFDNQVLPPADTYGSLSGSAAGRNAYARVYNSTTKAYEIRNLASPASAVSGADSDSVTAVEGSSGDIFSKYYALATNGTYIYFSKVYSDKNKDGTANLDSSGSADYLYYTTNPSGKTNISDIADTDINHFDVDEGYVLSISCTADKLLVGTSNGAHLVRLNSSSKVPEANVKFSNNGNSIVSECVFTTFVLDSSKNEGATDEYIVNTIYGSIGSSSDTWRDMGLYAYYPGRGNWNVDGD